MQIDKGGFFHLTYCTKIHPCHGWEDLFASIQGYVPALKARLAPDKRFGLGLRLSATESLDLLDHGNLKKFKDFLSLHDIYVFTINGFPYGPFRRQSVKTSVFSPDWREDNRVAYTERLIEILAALLPPGTEGSISTLPLSYKPWIAPGDVRSMERIICNLAHIAGLLLLIKEEQGAVIHLDLEPEPDGLLENANEVVDFFQHWLLPYGAPILAGWTGMSLGRAQALLLEHIRICLDTCHLAVTYEDFAAVLDLFQANGIRVGKIQITSGLKVMLPETQEQRQVLSRRLEPFSQSPYLHQVIASRDDGTFGHYQDLAEILPQLSTVADRQWRIHFHMPLYIGTYEGLSSTQEETRAILQLVKERRVCRHLELETYTWEVLPPNIQVDILDCLEKEYQWTLQALDLQEELPRVIPLAS
jgi:hypothetical protein|uniref:Xylose isomerase n=1 Tax=Desulfobacca acetoxidans TaxID=60893 RepID=A0A7V6A543_9BACT